MTPLSHPDGRLRELITQWRDAARQSTSDAYSNAFESCADELEALLAAVPVEEAAQLPRVAVGGRMERSIADFLRACDIHLVAQQESIMPDNALIAVLCDAVRLAREHLQLLASPGPVAGAVQRACCEPAPDHSGRTCDKPSGHADHWTYGGDTLTWASPAVAGAVPAPQWQPIETAPRDGTAFRAYAPSLVDADFNPWGSVEAVYEGDRIIGAVWNGQSDIWNTLPIEPTHWMPLPSPPRSEQDETQVKA